MDARRKTKHKHTYFESQRKTTFSGRDCLMNAKKIYSWFYSPPQDYDVFKTSYLTGKLGRVIWLNWIPG